MTELDDLVDEYSEVNHICCFLHIVNLIMKAMLRQFDISKCKKKGEAVDNEWEEMLRELTVDIEEEEQLMQTFGNGVMQDDTEDDLITNAKIDDALDMLVEELTDLQTEVHPVMLVLVKVSTTTECED